MKNHSYFVDKNKSVLAAIYSCVFLLLACVLLIRRHWLAMVLFLLMAFIFAAVALMFSAVIQIDASGVTHKLLWFRIRGLSWNEISEIGVINTKVFGKQSPHPKNIYIYFSPKALDDSERFDLALKWPPLYMSYLSFSRELLTDIQVHSHKTFYTYNIDNLSF